MYMEKLRAKNGQAVLQMQKEKKDQGGGLANQISRYFKEVAIKIFSMGLPWWRSG